MTAHKGPFRACTYVKDSNGDFLVRPGERVRPDLEGLDELLKHGAVEQGRGNEPTGQPLRWLAKVRVDKYEGFADNDVAAKDPCCEPDEVTQVEGNLLLVGGGSMLWHRATTASPTVDGIDSANAYLCVGNSTTAASATQTDLQGASKLRVLADSVDHTDSTSDTDALTVTLVATFDSGEANFAWDEWGVANGSAGRLINRRVEALGTKASGATWVLTVTLTLG